MPPTLKRMARREGSGQPLRALLLHNPHATTTDHRLRDVIASALSSAVDLDVRATEQRGHATELAVAGLAEGAEAVFVLGGDGTANEVVQALAGTPVALGVIPGGSTNVLVRALGLPNDPVAATAELLRAVRAGRRRSISLGRAGERWFGCNAGLGFDAAVVRHVEERDHLKRVFGQLAFVWSTTREWASVRTRGDAGVRIRLADGTELGPAGITLVANTAPYAYLGSRPLLAHPRASFDRGLDLLAIRTSTTPALLRVVRRVLRDASHVGLDDVTYLHDLPSLTLHADRLLPLMVDGDYAGEHRSVTFTSVPDALQVLC